MNIKNIHLLQSTISLPWKIDRACLQNPRKILQKMFIHIEILAKGVLTPMGNIENLVSSFSADFSHMIDLQTDVTDFVIIANESRGMNLAIQ